MPLPGLDRFSHGISAAALIRGPYSAEFLDSIQPVYVVGQLDEADDRVAYWYMTNRFIGAVAAQWSSYILRVSSGLAIVDGLSFNNSTGAVQFMQVGNGPRGVGWPVSEVAGTLANQYGGRAGVASPKSLAPVISDIRNNAGAAMTGVAINLSLGANGTGKPVYSWREGTLPQFILTPALNGGSEVALICEPTVVNSPLSVSAWGRWFPEAPVTV